MQRDDSQGLDTREQGGSPSLPAPVKTLTLLPMPEKTLSGTLTAELQQSSRDVALGRFQVWITNGFDHEIEPRRIVYKDDLLTRPVLGGRLRPIPSGSYRGYTLDLVEPICGGEEKGATVSVDLGEDVLSVPVEDETSVVGRWSKERCAERAIDADRAPGVVARHRGAGHGLRRDRPVQAHGDAHRRHGVVHDRHGRRHPAVHSGQRRLLDRGHQCAATDLAVTLELPAQPARCDAHGFGSATGARRSSSM